MRRLLKFVQDGDSVWWHGALWAAGMAGCELMRVLLFSVSWGVAYRLVKRYNIVSCIYNLCDLYYLEPELV